MPTDDFPKVPLATVSLSDRLTLELASLDTAKSVKVRLNRVGAQHLSEALLRFATSLSKSAGRDMVIGAVDLTERAGAEKRAVSVRVSDPPKRTRVKV